MRCDVFVPRLVQVGASCMNSGFLAFCVLAAAVAGCARTAEVPVGDAAKNIRLLALGYVQFAASHGGVGPPNQEALSKFLVESKKIPKAEVEKYFVSPRDNQPYEIFWGQRPVAMGPDSLKPSIIVVERAGADGTRFVADGMVGVKQLSAAEFAQAVPNAKAAGK